MKNWKIYNLSELFSKVTILLRFQTINNVKSHFFYENKKNKKQQSLVSKKAKIFNKS